MTKNSVLDVWSSFEHTSAFGATFVLFLSCLIYFGFFSKFSPLAFNNDPFPEFATSGIFDISSLVS